MSASRAFSVPLTDGCVSSMTEPLSLEMTGASSVPMMWTVTEVGVPSDDATLKLSVYVVPTTNSLWAELAV